MKSINKFKILDNTTIKLIAISIMLFNHIGLIFYNRAPIFIKIGEIAFPLFAFCIAEGFYHTRNRKKYLSNMLLFAILTELIFDFALYNKIYFLHQNVLFTFSLSIAFLIIYEHINNSKTNELLKVLMIAITFIIFLLISAFTFADNNPHGIILIYILYVFRNKPIIKYILTIFLLLISYKYGYALLSIPIMMMYNGKKGYNLKYFFYLFYPLHLLILLIIKKLIS